MLGEILRTLGFYAALGNDFTTAFQGFRKFVARLDEAERFDEEHLLPLAMEVFGTRVFPVASEYVAIKKTSRSKGIGKRWKRCEIAFGRQFYNTKRWQERESRLTNLYLQLIIPNKVS